MERQQRPQRPQAPQRPNQNQQGYNPNMQGYNPNMQQGYNPNMQQGYNPNMQQPNQRMTEQDFAEIGRKRKKKVLKVVGISFASIIVLCLLGWLVTNIASGRISSRVVELEAEVAYLQQTIVDNNAAHNQKVEELNQAIADTTVKEVVPTTSLQRVEASQVPELWLIEGDFIAPNPLKVPDATESVNDSYMQIGQKFVFRPSDRWVVTSQGATYEFGHPQQIWGKIRALSIKELIPEADMKPLISDFFVGYPATEITYNKIFIDDRVVGMRGKAKATVQYSVDEEVEVQVEREVEVPYESTEEYTEEVPVMQTITNEDGTTSEVQVMETITNADGTTTEVPKMQTVTKTRPVTKYETKTVTMTEKQTQKGTATAEKDIIINVGFVQKGEYALSFIFVYDAEGGSNSQELIDLLLRSGSYGYAGSAIKLE